MHYMTAASLEMSDEPKFWLDCRRSLPIYQKTRTNIKNQQYLHVNLPYAVCNTFKPLPNNITVSSLGDRYSSLILAHQ